MGNKSPHFTITKVRNLYPGLGCKGGKSGLLTVFSEQHTHTTLTSRVNMAAAGIEPWRPSGEVKQPSTTLSPGRLFGVKRIFTTET